MKFKGRLKKTKPIENKYTPTNVKCFVCGRVCKLDTFLHYDIWAVHNDLAVCMWCLDHHLAEEINGITNTVEYKKAWVRSGKYINSLDTGNNLDTSADVETDSVTKPNYYGKLDVLKFCLENNIPFCEGNIIKYVVRYTKKNGIEDLRKAQEYLNRLIDSFKEV